MPTKNISKLVSFTQSSGVELNINLVSKETSTRQEQKLRTLTQYVQKYPSGWKKRLELANLLYAMGKLERAVEEYRSCLVQKPQLIEVGLKLGKTLQLLGRKAEAVEAYESILCSSTSPRHLRQKRETCHSSSSPFPLQKRDVGNDEVRLSQISQATRQHILGLIAVCQDNTQKAIIAFESAAGLEPHNPSHWLLLGYLQMEREDAVAANFAFDSILSLKPDDLVALLASYDTLLALGNLPEAERRLNKAEELAADDFGVLKRLAHHRCRRRLVTGKQGKQTKQIITTTLKLAPNAPDSHVVLAYYHIFRGEWGKGVEVLQKFTELHPNNPNGWYYYGRCLFHTGEYQKAVEAMLLANRLYPDDSEIYWGLCEIVTSALAGEGRGDNIAAFLEEMLERFPQRWSVWVTMGRSLVESLGEIERGCRVSEEGTRLQPQLPDAWFRHGRVLALAEKHGEAVEALEKGWKLSQLHLTTPLATTELTVPEQWLPFPSPYQGEGCPKGRGEVTCVQSVSAAVWLGESYQALGDDEMSQKWWHKACDLAEKIRFYDPVMADYWQGIAFEYLGVFTAAVEAYGRALSGQLLFPVRVEVKAALKRLQGK